MAAVVSFIAPILTGGAAAGIGGFLTTTIAGRLITSVALSALSRAMAPKPRAPGMRNTQAMTGEAAPASLILGTMRTAGSYAAPSMSQGKAGKTPLAWSTHIYALAEGTGYELEAVVLDGERIVPGPGTSSEGYGDEIAIGDVTDRAWVRFKGGAQTVADTMMMDKHTAHPSRPWAPDMVGNGLSYALTTFRFDSKVMDSWPTINFVVKGRKLYDRRKDSTAGGLGAHRWNNPATWEYSANPAVQIENILRGIELAPGQVWGARLPADRVFGTSAAANVCDQAVAIASGGTQPRYEGHIEALASDQPREVIEELLKACNGQIADLGYGWRIRAGAPGLPVATITDDDLLISRPQDFEPFRSEAETVNAASPMFTSAAENYQSKNGPTWTNADWVAEDGGEEHFRVISMPAVTDGRQAQRVMRAMLRDHRRQRVHQIAVGLRAKAWEPLDVIAWTSARNGYDAKSFEIVEKTEDLMRGVSVLTIREVDPTDYDWDLEDEIPQPAVSVVKIRPAAQTVPGFNVVGAVDVDGEGRNRKPGFSVTWDPDDLDDVEAIEVQVRRVGDTKARRTITISDVENGEDFILGGVIPGTVRQFRARPVVKRRRAWTDWISATAPAVFLSDPDFGDDDNAFRAFMRARNITPVEIVSTLPTTAPADPDDLVNYQGEIYRWNGSGWTKAVPVSDLDGQITDAAIFASTIRPVEVLAALPAPSDPANVIGRQVHLTTDNKVYRWTGTEWTVKTDGADILAGSIYAQSLALADFTNLVPDNQLINPASWALLDPGITFFDNSAALGAPPEASIGWIRFQPTGALQRAQSRPFPVTPGDKLYLSAQMWRRSGTGSATIRLQINFLDRTGGFISGANVTATGTGVARYVGNATVPASAQTAVVQGRVEAGGSGDWVFTSPIVRRKASGVLNVDGTVNAAEIDTDFMSVAGLAVFGGALASANYASGVSGWRIDRNGNAELNSLIVRTGMLDANATGFNAETYSLALDTWGHTVGSPSTSFGGTAISITITDPAVVGKPLTVTFSAEARITRSVIGNVQGDMAIVVGGTQTATYSLRSYISQANGLHIAPIAFTRRIVAPAVPFTVSTLASTTPVGADNHSASLGLRARSLQVQVRKDEA